MFDVHLTTIKVIDIENNKVVIDSTFGEKEYVLDKIKNGVKFELPKYKSALQYQEKNDICYVFTNNQGKKLFTALDSKLTQELFKNNIVILSNKKGATLGSIIIMLYIQRFLIHYLH